MAARGPLPSPFSLPSLRGDNTFAATQAEPPEADVSPPPWLAADALAIWEEKAPPLIVSGRCDPRRARPSPCTANSPPTANGSPVRSQRRATSSARRRTRSAGSCGTLAGTY